MKRDSKHRELIVLGEREKRRIGEAEARSGAVR